MESPGERFRLAVQWHPETRTDRQLFQALVAAAGAVTPPTQRAAASPDDGAAIDRRARAAMRRAACGATCQGTAGSPDLDVLDAWASILVVPRVLQGMTGVDTSVDHWRGRARHSRGRGGHGSPPAGPSGRRGCHRGRGRGTGRFDGVLELGRRRGHGIRSRGESPWWAQVYVLRDRGRTYDYLDRCVAAGARAIVVTVDYPGTSASPSFRAATSRRLDGHPGQLPGLDLAGDVGGDRPGTDTGRHRRARRQDRPADPGQGRAARR